MKLKTKFEKDFHLKELITGSSQHFVLQALGILLTYLFILLVSRVFGPKVYGDYTLALTILNIFVVAGKLGMDTAVVKFIAVSRAREDYRTARSYYFNSLKLALLLGVFLTILLLVFAPSISGYIFRKSYLANYLVVAAPGILPFILRNLNAGVLRGLKNIKEFAILRYVLPRLALLLILALLLVAGSRDGRITILSYVIALFLVMALSFHKINKEFKGFKHSPAVDEDKEACEQETGYRSILRISVPMFMTDSLFLMMSWVNVLMIGMFSTGADVGIYNVAVKLALITSLTLNAVNSIAAPKFAEMFGKKDYRGLKKIARQSTRMIFFTSFPLLAVYIAAPQLVLSVFGGEFESGFLALTMIAAGQFFNSICGSVANILNMTGYQHVVKNIILAAVLINIGLNCLLIPQYGINGAAFSYMIATISWNLGMILYVYKVYGFWTVYLPGPWNSTEKA
jgi:O-antigen/teichoic acid export membrane protein